MVLKNNEFIDNKLYYYLKPTDLPEPRFHGQPIGRRLKPTESRELKTKKVTRNPTLTDRFIVFYCSYKDWLCFIFLRAISVFINSFFIFRVSFYEKKKDIFLVVFSFTATILHRRCFKFVFYYVKKGFWFEYIKEGRVIDSMFSKHVCSTRSTK